jgi:hypothetical protein
MNLTFSQIYSFGVFDYTYNTYKGSHGYITEI